MMNKKYLNYLIIILLGIICLGSIMAEGAASATNEQALLLQRIDVLQSPYQMGLELMKLAPDSIKSLHVHSGPEVGYVLEGELILMIKGQPSKTIKAGESFQTQAGVIHQTKAGPDGAKVLATWIVEQGKTLSMPVK